MKVKKIPERMCIACKNMFPKRELLRIVKNGEDISLDFTGKANGRGAYICDNPDCIKKCVKQKLLNRAFSQEIPEAVYRYVEEDYAKHKN